MERHFRLELDELKQRLLWMGGLAERAVHQSVRSLVELNDDLAGKVLEEEPAINEMEIEIDERVMRLLALYQLVALDLRFVLAVTRINAELERIGDQAVNIAQSAQRMLRHPRVNPLIDVPRMSELAERMVRDSLDAFVQSDVELAKTVLSRDDAADCMRDQMFHELLAYMMENPSVILPTFQLVLGVKDLERIGDHATNIAEDVIYMVAGRDVRHHAVDRR